MKRRDRTTADLFATPRPIQPEPGSMDFRARVTGLVAEMLEQAARKGLDRWRIAGDVLRLAGREVSKYMLDAYTAPSREEYNAPAWLVPLIEVACESHVYTNWLADLRGGRFYSGDDALAAELGRIHRERDALDVKARALRDHMRRAG